MFSYLIDLSEVKRALRRMCDAQWRILAGAAFMALALAAIEYEEFIAPGVSRLSDGWSNVATDVSRRLASFAL